LIVQNDALKLTRCSRSEETMRAITIAAVLAAGLALPSLAAAQTGRGGTGGAPVGHRQPATKEVTKDPATPRVTVTKEDRALDRALKGICRGC